MTRYLHKHVNGMSPEAKRLIAFYEGKIEALHTEFSCLQSRYDTLAVIRMAWILGEIDRLERLVAEYQIGKVLS